MEPPADSRANGLLAVIRVDGIGALVVGLLMLVLRVPLASLYGMSTEWVTGLATVNLVYSSIGITLLARGLKPSWGVWVLIAANGTWTPIAWMLAFAVRNSASPFGVAYLALEGAYVLGLACVEAKLALRSCRD